jgi:glycosyltransferase involved in cell wall biosynthesis
MSGQLKFSVIIPCLNEEEVIYKCLQSLCLMDYPKGDFEVVTVDNGSTDGTIETAKKFASTLNLRIETLVEGRVTALRNLGASKAAGKYLAFLDADCVVPREWLQVAEQMLAVPETGIIGGHCGITSDSTWVARTWYGYRRTQKSGDVSYVPGANLLVSRANFARVGGFDSSLETNEDCELCQRARRRGLSVIAYPELGVTHLRDPQTLAAFFKKQAWHGKHVLKVFLSHFPSTVNIRPVLFSFYMLVMTLALCGSAVLLRFEMVLWSLALLLLPSTGLSLWVAAKRGEWKQIPALVGLYLTYGFGRASAVLNLRNWLSSAKTTDRMVKTASESSHSG